MKFKLFHLAAVGLLVFLAGCSPKPEYRNTTVEFPANTFQKTEYNADVFDIEPFALHMNIPFDWEFRGPEEDGIVESDLWSPVGIYKDDMLIGSIGYNTFVYYPEAEGNPVAVYNQLMLGSVVNWNHDYTPIVESDTLNTATCRIARSQIELGMSNAEAPIIYRQGVLAHDNELLVYIGMEIDEGALSEEQLDMLVTSIALESLSSPEKTSVPQNNVRDIQNPKELAGSPSRIYFIQNNRGSCTTRVVRAINKSKIENMDD